MLGSLLAIVLFSVAVYSVRKLYTAASEPVKLGAGETSIAEVLVKTDELKHSTFGITSRHINEGRLVITNMRVLYLSYDQKKTTLAVPLGEISQVEAGTTKKFLTSTPVVAIAYRFGGRDDRTTWSLPPEMVASGNPLLFGSGFKVLTNRYTAEEFAELLNRERAKHQGSSVVGPEQGSCQPNPQSVLRPKPTETIDARARDGWTPLHAAAAEGNRQAAELLLAGNSCVNSRATDGGTPLHFAAFQGYKEVAELLLKNGADVNARDKDGETSLRLAAEQGHTHLAKLLRQYGGRV